MRITPNNIQELKENEIFVFGSNAIPTKDKSVKNTLKIDYIVDYINNFITFTKNNQNLIFFVTEIGCGSQRKWI